MEVENIKEGLKIAITKGESLQQAMQSFYNAGYKQEEIQQAAALISQEGFTQVSQQQTPNQNYPQQDPQDVYEPNQPNQTYQPQQPQNTQTVSSYGEKEEEDPRKTMIIVVTSLLVILGLVLGGLFLFREQVIAFFESLFG